MKKMKKEKEEKEKEYLLDDNDIISLIDQHLQIEIVPDKKTPKKIPEKKIMKAVLHLEVSENDISLSKEDWDKLSKFEKEFELSKALYDCIKRIDDWSQVFEFEEN